MDAKKILAAVASLAMVAGPAFAHRNPPMPDRDITVINYNKDTAVTNVVKVDAFTGTNLAAGGDGGAGGDVSGRGTGGDGGNGGDGGTIVTGDAYAKAKVINLVNTNITRIRR